MNRNLDSPTKLTEFAPLSPTEEESAGLTYIFSKLFKKPQSVPDDTKTDSTSVHSTSSSSSVTNIVDNQEKVSVREVAESTVVLDGSELEGRSLPNVLKRISNLLALKNTGKQSYNETDLKQYWMPDSVSKECYDCGEKFTTFRRRHHCRVCGQIFCSKCCNQEIPGRIMNCTGGLRVCTYCGKVVLSYLESADMRAELSADLRALQDDLQVKFGAAPTPLSPNSLLPVPTQDDDPHPRRKTSVGYQEEKFATNRVEGSGGEEKSSLRSLLEEAVRSGGLVRGSHRYRLRTYHSSFPGHLLANWLIANNKANSRLQAVALGQAMLNSGYIEGIETDEFSDEGILLYRLAISEILPRHAESESEGSNDLSQSSSQFNLDLNVDEKTAMISRQDDDQISSISSSKLDGGLKEMVELCREAERPKALDWESPETVELSDKHAYLALQNVYEDHCQSLVGQLLQAEEVSQSWSDIVIPLAKQTVHSVFPDLSRSDDMDIRSYVQVKKVAEGERSECSIISGVACSKSLAHRAMPTCIDNPRILLVGCPISFERIEGRLLSLEPVIMQEEEYVNNTVSRLCSLRPDVVLAGRAVCRKAQEALRHAGIAFSLNVKWSTLERLARVSNADILTSIDAHLGRPRLASCRKFYLTKYKISTGDVKTLMVFEGCPESRLGATVLLRGGTASELISIKRVLLLSIFAYYNARLEVSYLMDAHALPPPQPSLTDLEGEESEPAQNDENTTPKQKSNEHVSITQPRTPQPDTKDQERVQLSKETTPSQPSLDESVKCEVVDLSDPLQTKLADDLPVPPAAPLTVAPPLPHSCRLRQALDETILSISPYLKVSLPYLESEAGRQCKLRCYFGSKLYWSPQLEDTDQARSKPLPSSPSPTPPLKMHTQHELVGAQLIESADSEAVRAMIADYRAVGGRLPFRPGPLLPVPPESPPPPPACDVLNPRAHQRLPVLFSSYSPHSSNAPAFCVDPWVVEMEFYGKNDIALGSFLKRYCFRGEYMCPSESCTVGMMHHTRRFVHQAGAVSVLLAHTRPPLSHDHLLMWNYCKLCATASPVVAMSNQTWCLSFAKYLEQRFHGVMYGVRSSSHCSHSLHQDCVQYFAQKDTIAWFTYERISPWEVCLPSAELAVGEIDFSVESVLSEVRAWTQTGHHVFSAIHNALQQYPQAESWVGALRQQLNKDQTFFKSRIEAIQIKLTSPPLLDTNLDKNERLEEIWAVEDALVLLKRLLAETVADWNRHLADADAAALRKKKSSESKSSTSGDIIDGVCESDGVEVAVAGLEEQQDEPVMKLSVPDSDTTDNEEGEGNSIGLENKQSIPSDKKTVKTLLSQLLNSQPSSAHIQNPMVDSEHHCLPLGFSVPSIVYEKEPSSIVAYALSSHDYRQQLDPTTTPPPVRSDRGRSTPEPEDPSDIEQTTRNNKSSHNIEVEFSDSVADFKVKVYFAEEFARLRSLVLKQGEESFVRSLTRCIVWAASGGKSGSTFYKTKDDRFVLKELSRIETKIFVEIAPQYFTYVETCVRTKSPTLLGKILGLFRVAYRNHTANTTSKINLVVMEHLFHGHKVEDKYDLKGSSRNRLVQSVHTDTVLLDQNLINMTCDSPLYMLCHTKAILMQAIHNDTQFLSTQSVMDYSLLIGLDSSSNQLVVGIIDYIRTFTWDKKLETMVKKYGLGKQPTIISPDEYRDRFIAAMHRYFLAVPDRWVGLSHSIDC